MLDNLQSAMEPSNNMGSNKMLPIEILADAKVEQANNAKSQKSNKTKSILNWLKQSSNNNNNTVDHLTATAIQTQTKNSDIIISERNNSNNINLNQRHNQFDKRTKQPTTATPSETAIDLAQQPQQIRNSNNGCCACACAANECTCSLLKQPNNTHHNNCNKSKTLIAASSCSGGDETLREFRGVQTLKHLWNKRITANKESALRAKIFRQRQQQQHFTKSQSCLLTTSDLKQDLPTPSGESPASDSSFQRRKLRAQSLYDCSQDLEYALDLNDIEIQKHLQKDNFYKYKTAEQASKLRELSEYSVARRFSTGLLLPLVQGYHKAERLQWLKRPDIFSRRKTVDNVDMAKPEKLHNGYNASCDTLSQADDIVINDTPPQSPAQHSSNSTTSLPRASSQSDNASSLCQSQTTTPTLTANNSPLRSGLQSAESVISRNSSTGSLANNSSGRPSVKRNNSTKRSRLKSNESAISRNSSAASLANSSGGLRQPVKRSSSKKYSFKTRNYHAPRRMHSIHKETSSAATSHGQQGSLVAKLTQQFNEIIQHDKGLLEEVKRKNGVLMTHKGHIYKIVDTTKAGSQAVLTRTSSRPYSKNPAELDESGRSTPSNNSLLNASAVQKTIRKFENVSRGSVKPKIPLKSLKVIKKSNELVITKVGRPIHPSHLKPSNEKQDMNMKADIKSAQTLSLHTALEMVKEEAKTPIESKDINLTVKQMQTERESKIIPEEENEITLEFDLPTTNELTINSLSFHEDSTSSSSTTQSHDSSDNFFEEVPKLKKIVSGEEHFFRSSGRRSTRKSSIVVEDLSRDILLYINKNDNKLDNLSSEIEQQIDKSSTEDFLIYEHNTTLSQEESKLSKSNKLQTDSTKEASEKLYSLPKFLKSSGKKTDINQQFVINELQSKLDDQQKGAKANKYDINQEFLNGELQSKLEEQKNHINRKEETLCEYDTQSKQSLYENGTKSMHSTEEESISTSSEHSPESKKSKSKHSKFYEKLKFFTLSRKNPKLSPTKMEELPIEILTTSNSIDSQLQNYTPMSSPKPQHRIKSDDVLYSPMEDPGSKLLDALEEVDKKLQTLKIDVEDHMETPTKAVDSDDYGKHIKPNTSFLHQKYANDLPKPAQLIQAVNVTLVNAIEGEQMIMEQKEIQQSGPADVVEAAQNQITSVAATNDEPLYEPIGLCKIEEPQYLKTECNLQEVVACNLKEEDIYQTVEEIKEEVYVKKSQNQMEKVPTISATSQLMDDYEIIEDPDKSVLTLNCNLLTPKPTVNFDGYEECSPSALECSIATASNSFVPMRKTTDELPDLPKPRRKLPKSPMPKRISPIIPDITPECIQIVSSKSHAVESHYYAGEEEEEEEDIYDTIHQGSHCYESLHSVNSKLQKSSSTCTKNADTISFQSNCYESITHFKPIPARSHYSGSSSHGSSLTLSSENKTNSLYEDSLGSSMHYSSKRIYRRNTDTHIEIPKSMKVKNNNSSSVGIYNSSMGRASDTSDDWTDISDNEHEGVDGDVEEHKPQFIIVRAKAHKSPDWSRRVRDKRLHHQRKSKSCIEDDDPDHYYEQLSPSALSKRHSLGLQQRTNSLQRNQDAVRVSKRGKLFSHSAHALGQHISDDSFDSDTDDYYESEHIKNAHNDSGVDIRTSKLPEPPASSNQMYAFVKKFKNFIVNKKSPNSSKHGGSQQKIDDTSSQFYVNGNFYNGGNGSQTKLSTLEVPQTKELSTSEKNLIMAQSNVTTTEQLNSSTTPRKAKTSKSLRYRIRKSLVGFDNKQLATLTPTRSTFYVEEPSQLDETNGQMDSGFSEKASSGDLPKDTQNISTVARKGKKEGKLGNMQRRRTTIGIRPIEPPPPPPDNNGNMKRQSNTSWYAECGVFKNGTTNLVHDDTQLMNGQNGSSNNINSGASWYEEAGLYQTSGISVASSSGSSGVSTSNEAGPADEMSHSLFSNEPLYQIYSAAKLEAISRDMHDESSTDGYEEIGDRRRSANSEVGGHRKSSRPTALQLVEPKSGPERTLWSQIPEVVNSMIIPTMTPRERALMEAKFEIITSEASYLKSLNLLRNHYMNHPVFRDQNLVNSRDRKCLFAHIVPVHECSERLLTELESCWQDNIMLIGLSKRIYAIAEKHFHVYVGFCEHQGRMDRTLKRLRAAKGLFSQNLELLESSPLCCGLNLHSFLMLPMQRITRLPLLIDAVFSKCHPNDDEYDNWKMCLAIMNKIVTQCNEAATKSDQAFEIEKISRQLEFNPSTIRPLAIAPAGVLAPGSKPRFLVKKGEFTHLIWRGDDAKLTFGKKFTKTQIYAFLFSDLLVLTKRKGEEQFSVFDYCPRNMLTITSGDTLPQLPTKDLNSQTSKNLILMTLLENHKRKTNELLLSCPSVSEQERWLQAMRPPESETPGEKLYEQWDCPQVITKHLYENNEPDGLSLEVGDVVNVTRKLPDGWYQGERIRDGTIGWFPGSYTEEVNSAHVRARNLKLRHRLLTFTATYLEAQKRNK